MKTSGVIVFSLTYLQNKTTVYRGGCSDFFGGTDNFDQNWGRGDMNFDQNGWGSTFFNFVWGGINFTKGQCFEKKCAMWSYLLQFCSYLDF